MVQGGTFDTGDVSLQAIAGHACRLRAVPANGEADDDDSSYAAAQIAVSEADLPVSLASGTNSGAPFNYYVNAVTFNTFATWSAAGTPSRSLKLDHAICLRRTQRGADRCQLQRGQQLCARLRRVAAGR